MTPKNRSTVIVRNHFLRVGEEQSESEERGKSGVVHHE